MRKIPFKNYVIAFVAVLATCLLAWYCCQIYKQRHENKYLTIMLPFLAEIKEVDIENYILDRQTVVLYISDKTDPSLEDKETEMKEFITNKGLQQNFVYVDISEDREKSLANFQKRYQLKLDYNHLPILVIFTDRKVTGVYNEKDWDIHAIADLLEQNEVIESD